MAAHRLYRITSTFPDAVTLIQLDGVCLRARLVRGDNQRLSASIPSYFRFSMQIGRQTTAQLVNKPGALAPTPDAVVAPPLWQSLPVRATATLMRGQQTFSFVISGGTPSVQRQRGDQSGSDTRSLIRKIVSHRRDCADKRHSRARRVVDFGCRRGSKRAAEVDNRQLSPALKTIRMVFRGRLRG